MNKLKIFSLPVLLFLIFGCTLMPAEALGQQTGNTSAGLPDNITGIFAKSCAPCHTTQGGILSRTKFNFNIWTQYSPEKQKEKADKIYSVLEKGKMPPKVARENRPDIIPSEEQIGFIKKWASSLRPDDKK